MSASEPDLQMAYSDASLACGSPRFADPVLAQLATAQGDAAAWAAAFDRQGTRAAASVSGDFAVGLRDAQGRTWLAIDRFAVRSLCYRVIDGKLHFAERANTLAAMQSGVEANIAPQGIFDYLYFHAIPSPRTVFNEVHRLPPGHCALFENGKLTVSPYWVPEFCEPTTRPSFAALRDEFRALLTEAVAVQLDGSKPACFLSGGTDSSTVAGLIGQVAGEPADTYSIGFEAEGYDEMAYARLASRHFGTRHHEHYVTPADLVRLIPEVAAHHDQPFGNSSTLPSYFCALKAREDGVTRLLAGDGGDELFGGNTRYAKQRVFAWYDSVPAFLRSGLLDPLSASGALDRVPLLSKGASYVRQARVPMPDRLQTYNLLDRLGRAEVLTPAFAARIDANGPLAQQRAVWVTSEGASFVNRMLAYDWRYTLAENDLPKVRSSTELAGVSVGFPFLDQALLDFSSKLPIDFKLRGFKLRWFFKEALRGFLPDDIITKKKHGFGLPFGVWAVRNAGLNALARDSVAGLGERGIVRREFTHELMTRYLPEHPGFYGEMVWILMMLEQWFRHHAPDYRLGD